MVVLDDPAALHFKLLTSSSGVTRTGRGLEKVVFKYQHGDHDPELDKQQLLPHANEWARHMLDAATKEMMQELPVLNPPAGIKGSYVGKIFLVKRICPDESIYHSTAWDMVSVDDNTLGNNAGKSG
ncbi:hypothetical protein B0H19DRAFT_1066548 [Mycena capillaripes]|nr:hypothetical protein B0H19DRAFT_1066548 [Mycena capillaripes]